MAALRALHERLGHRNVATYIQSGNVVFEASDSDSKALEKSIREALEREFAFEIPVIIRTAAELAAAATASPYAAREEHAKVAVAFLSREPAPGAADSIDRTSLTPDEFTLIGREVHLHCPDGFGRARLTNTFLEQRLGVEATTRNWRTVTRLVDLTGRP
jgi:uncharacterized protein (DUF1697 family)